MRAQVALALDTGLIELAVLERIWKRPFPRVEIKFGRYEIIKKITNKQT